jgi:hypothetical protein
MKDNWLLASIAAIVLNHAFSWSSIHRSLQLG